MPSLTAPQGNIPAQGSDVKPSTSSSVVEKEAAPKVDRQESPKESAPKSTQDPEVDESDLAAVEENKKVPYNRFKEKVEETKSLKQRIEAMERQSQLAIQRAAEDAELRVRARLQQEREAAQVEESLDPVERKIHSQDSELAKVKAELAEMRQQGEHQATKALLSRLQQKYPEADDLAVLGWAKAQGIKPSNEDAFEELMAASHNRNVDRDAAGIRKILEQKKARAKTAIPTREGGIRLKDGEKPKSLKEAAALTKRFFESGG